MTLISCVNHRWLQRSTNLQVINPGMHCVELVRSGPLEEEAIKVATTQHHPFCRVIYQVWVLTHEVNLLEDLNTVQSTTFKVTT